MFRGNELIFGVAFTLFGLLMLVITIADRVNSGKSEVWGESMFFKGIVAGVSFFVLGVILLVKYF